MATSAHVSLYLTDFTAYPDRSNSLTVTPIWSKTGEY